MKRYNSKYYEEKDLSVWYTWDIVVLLYWEGNSKTITKLPTIRIQELSTQLSRKNVKKNTHFFRDLFAPHRSFTYFMFLRSTFVVVCYFMIRLANTNKNVNVNTQMRKNRVITMRNEILCPFHLRIVYCMFADS